MKKTLFTSFIFTSKIPETPIWLLSKKREEQAEKSLQCLRGGVSKQAISKELAQMKKVSELSISCQACEKQSIKCQHPPPALIEKFRSMTRKRTVRPFILIVILLFLMQFSGMFAMRPYLVPILKAHGITLDANVVTTILGSIGILANVVIVASIRALGKRRIYLYSMIGNFLSCFGLSKLKNRKRMLWTHTELVSL